MYVEPLNLRIRSWGQYLMDDPAIESEVNIPNARERFTYKTITETIMSNSYIIEIVITTCKHYHQALLDGRVTWKQSDS